MWHPIKHLLNLVLNQTPLMATKASDRPDRINVVVTSSIPGMHACTRDRHWTTGQLQRLGGAAGAASAQLDRVRQADWSKVIFWCSYKQDDGAKFSLLNSAIAPIICQGTGHRDTGQWRLSQPASQDSDLTWGYAACAAQWGGADLRPVRFG